MHAEAVAERTAKKASEKYDDIAIAHASMTTRILEDQHKIQNAEDKLASDREKRSGMDSGQVAVNEFSRFVAKASADDAIMVAKLESLYKAHNAKLSEALHAGTMEERDSLNREAKKGLDEIGRVTAEIAANRKVTSIEITNKMESSEEEVKVHLSDKIMANAESLQKDLQAIVDSKDGAGAPATLQALSQINKLIDGGKVSADQLKNVISTFGHSIDATTVDQREFLGALSKSDEALVAAAKASQVSITQNSAKIHETVQATAEAQQTHHVETVAAIGTLAPKASDAQAVVKAVQDVGTAFDAQGAAVISALTALAGKVAAMQSAIQQLAIRNR